MKNKPIVSFNQALQSESYVLKFYCEFNVIYVIRLALSLK